MLIGMVGAKVAVDPHNSLTASEAIDFVCREEFDFTCKEIAEGQPFAQIHGLSYRSRDGSIEHNEARADSREHGRAAVRRARVQARSERSTTTSSAI